MSNNISILSLIAYAAVVPSLACAQQRDDTKLILDAMKGLEQRIDGMQRQIDQIKGSGNVVAPAAPKSVERTPALTAQVPQGMKPMAGWVVSVLPNSKGQREPDALFRFSRPRLPITFNSHLATRPIDDWVKYRGDAQLQIFDAGRHVFFVELRDPGSHSGSHCGGYLRIGKNSLINIGDEDSNNSNDRTQARPKENKTLSAGITLEAGNHDIAFLLACHNGCQVAGNPQCRQFWHSTSVDILVRGPSDDAPRPFAAREIVHMVRNAPSAPAKAEQPRQSSTWESRTQPGTKAASPPTR